MLLGETMASLSDENLSVKLFKPQRTSLETSFISNSVEELVYFNPKTKNWYREIPFAYWARLGIDIIEVMSVISNITVSTNKRTREGIFDTVYEYGSGNWCYEFSQKATEYVTKAQEACENNDNDNAFKFYRLAYLYFAIASYPHLKGDELGEQALIQHYIYYKKAVEFLPGHFEELKVDVEGKTVSAYLHTPNKSEVLPCVVIYSNYHNLSTEYLRYYREHLYPRNIAMLSVDLPAVGLSRAFDLKPDIGFIHNAVIEHVINNCLYINRNKIGLLSQRFGSIAAVHSLIKFNNNIKLSEAVDIRSDVAIDLNGFTFDGNALFIEENVEMSISGGTIEAYPRNRGGNLIISDCTINGSIYAIDNVTGTVRLDNPTVYAQLLISGGTVELGADVTLIDTNALCTRGDGSIICHFDPSGHLEKYSKATNNGDGTWTVRYSK
jgi:esterase FrsA